jgi:bacteriocin biosynthesis cyclodehydratase domain-containing protein
LLLLLLLAGRQELTVDRPMLLPGVRLVERPGVLHFFDGRRVVSVRGDEAGRRAVREAIGVTAGVGGQPVDDARDLIDRLRLGTDDGLQDGHHGDPVALGASFASASVAGWVSPLEAHEHLRGTDVHVWDAPGGALLDTLSASGLRCAAFYGPDQLAAVDPGRSVVVVAASDEQPTQRLNAANAACIAHGLTWLPVGAYDGAAVRVGPLMIPGQTACADCLLRRLAANVEYAEVYRDVAEAPAAPTPPALRAWSHSVAALILLRWVANHDVRLPGRLFTLVPDDLQIRQGTVYRVPRCETCAAPDFVTAAAPWDIARDH